MDNQINTKTSFELELLLEQGYKPTLSDTDLYLSVGSADELYERVVNLDTAVVLAVILKKINDLTDRVDSCEDQISALTAWNSQ